MYPRGPVEGHLPAKKKVVSSSPTEGVNVFFRICVGKADFFRAFTGFLRGLNIPLSQPGLVQLVLERRQATVALQ
jgi:hypothetical protein